MKKNILGIVYCSLIVLTGCQTIKLNNPIEIQKQIQENKQELKKYDYQSIIDYSLNNNYDLLTYENKLKEINLLINKNKNYPILSTNLQRTNNKINGKTTNTVSQSFNLNYDLDLFNKKNDSNEITLLEKNNLFLNKEIIKNNIIYNITLSWKKIQNLFKEKEIIMNKLILYKKLINFMEKRYFENSIDYQNILLQKNQILALQDDLGRIYKELNLNTNIISKLSNSKIQPSYLKNTINKKIKLNNIDNIKLKELINNNLNIKIYENNIKKEYLNTIISKKNLYPNISLNLSLNTNDTIETFFSQWIRNFIISTNLILFDNNKNINIKIAKNKDELEILKYLQFVYNESLVLQDNFSNYKYLKNDINITKKQNKNKENIYKILLDKYKKGIINSIQLLQEQNNLLDNKLSLLNKDNQLFQIKLKILQQVNQLKEIK